MLLRTSATLKRWEDTNFEKNSTFFFLKHLAKKIDIGFSETIESFSNFFRMIDSPIQDYLSDAIE